MGVVNQAMNKRRLDLLAVISLMLLLLAALHMMSGAVQRSEDLGQWFVPLLLFTVIGLAALVILVGWNLWQLVSDYRSKATGSRLAMRFSIFFVLLALAPVSVVYFYSLQFLSSGIDSWFDVQVDTAMEDALALSQLSLDLHKRELVRLTEGHMNGMNDESLAGLALSVQEMRDTSNATEMTLYDANGKSLTMSHENPEILTSSPIDRGVIHQVLDGQNYVGVMPSEAGPLVIQVVVADAQQRGLILQAIYPVSERLNDLSRRVQDAYTEYRERNYLRDSIKFSFGLTLSLVMAMALFAAIWAGIYASRRLVKPLSDIVRGTKAVADGEYDKQLPVPRFKDELGFLVSSFNAMTRRIARARNAAEASRREAQAQHAYLETVLGSLSSGVMVLDHESVINTSNPQAEIILSLPLDEYHGQLFHDLSVENEQIQPFVDNVEKSIHDHAGEGRVEVSLYQGRGRQVLLIRHSPLVMGQDKPGHVLVFDDVTELVRAQRDAAWGEVARRLAHEIKNPLTPIQLSAERVRRRYLSKFSEEEGQVLDRATTTIVQQVEAMKSMVNEFSDYAKPCQMSREPLELDEFLTEVMALYEGRKDVARVQTDAAGLKVEADPVRLRQVVHNLVKNGLEAIHEAEDGQVRVSTRIARERECQHVEINICDNGPGFNQEMIGQVFEPYVSTKSRGTGLGLAIVKRIVGEHGGIIIAENQDQGGARVVVRLPSIGNEDTPPYCQTVSQQEH